MILNWNNDGIYQYLDVVFDDMATIDNYTYNMINELPNGYLKCVCEQIDPPTYKYGLNGKRSLEYYIERQISQVKMLHIINQIAEQVLALSDYLIDIRQVYLSDQTIFIDLLTEEVQLLVVPTQQRDDFTSFQQWLLMHIEKYRHTIYHGTQSLAFYNYVKSDHFCLAGLMSFIKEQANREQANKTHPRTQADHIQLTNGNIQKNEKVITDDDKKVKNSNKMTILPYVALFLLQICLAIIYSVVFLTLPKLTGDLFIARLGALLVIFSADIIISRWLLNQYSMTLFAKKNLFKKLPTGKNDRKSAGQDIAETTLLSRTKQDAFLFDISANQSYPLNVIDTLIGRQQKSVDICLNSNAIGRKHCKIVKRDNVYWITDLASKNGTYINDVRLNRQDAKQLYNGDKLRLADSEFVFVNNKIQNSSQRFELKAL